MYTAVVLFEIIGDIPPGCILSPSYFVKDPDNPTLKLPTCKPGIG